MNLKELTQKTKEARENCEREKTNKDLKKTYNYLYNQMLFAKKFSEEVKDENTAVILYTTKQFKLFLSQSRKICYRINKGYYVNCKRYLIKELNSGNREDILRALKRLGFEYERFTNDTPWEEIKFEIILKELDKGVYSF